VSGRYEYEVRLAKNALVLPLHPPLPPLTFVPIIVLFAQRNNTCNTEGMWKGRRREKGESSMGYGRVGNNEVSLSTFLGRYTRPNTFIIMNVQVS
jgi:hypothetical protein